MEKLESKAIGQIVAEDFRAARVFEKYQIDFCCKGNRPLEEVASESNLDLDSLTAEIEEVKTSGVQGDHNFDSWPLDLLADYIVKTHHKYTEEQTTKLKPYIEKLCQVHGDHHPELFEIKEIFGKLSGDVAAHMKKEEIILFPFIKKVVAAKDAGEKLEAPASRMENPVNMMMHDHSDQGDMFRKIAELSNEYTLPADGCNTYNVTLNMLKELEQDLHKHIHLENNILFPKAVAMGKKWTTA